jgi:hypothetical protein
VLAIRMPGIEHHWKSKTRLLSPSQPGFLCLYALLGPYARYCLIQTTLFDYYVFAHD